MFCPVALGNVGGVRHHVLELLEPRCCRAPTATPITTMKISTGIRKAQNAARISSAETTRIDVSSRDPNDLASRTG
jgi:hypothetical protein